MDEEKRKQIKERLNRVFQDVFDDDIQIFDKMNSDDIEEWDSLIHITLVVAIEKEFCLELNATEVGQLKNVGAMLDIIMERVTT
jgi:acyl carrier protein